MKENIKPSNSLGFFYLAYCMAKVQSVLVIFPALARKAL